MLIIEEAQYSLLSYFFLQKKKNKRNCRGHCLANGPINRRNGLLPKKKIKMNPQRNPSLEVLLVSFCEISRLITVLSVIDPLLLQWILSCLWSFWNSHWSVTKLQFLPQPIYQKLSTGNTSASVVLWPSIHGKSFSSLHPCRSFIYIYIYHH